VSIMSVCSFVEYLCHDSRSVALAVALGTRCREQGMCHLKRPLMFNLPAHWLAGAELTPWQWQLFLSQFSSLPVGCGSGGRRLCQVGVAVILRHIMTCRLTPAQRFRWSFGRCLLSPSGQRCWCLPKVVSFVLWLSVLHYEIHMGCQLSAGHC